MDIEKKELPSPPLGYRPSWRTTKDSSTTRRDNRRSWRDKSEFWKYSHDHSPSWDVKSEWSSRTRDNRSSWRVKSGLSSSPHVYAPVWPVMGVNAPEPDLTALPLVSAGRASHQRRSWRDSAKSIISSNGSGRQNNEPGDEGRPRGWRLAAIVVALCLAVFCMALDNTIIATAIPRITDTFHALEDVAWYISAYLLTTCSFQLFFGRLYTFFPVKWVFLIAVGLFELGSLLCGVAPTSPALIIGRAIAGTGAAGIFSGGILVISLSVPLRQRPIYIGLAASMFGIASVAGPLLGGIFTDRLSWRWCFYINLPIGGVTTAFILLFFHEPPRRVYEKLMWREKVKKLDFPGTVLFIPAVICLILALQWGGLTYPWTDWRVLLPLIAFVVLLAAFIYVQYRQQDDGTVPPRIIMQRSVGGAAWYAVMFGGALFILIYYVPIWFQSIWGVSATQSGIDSLPLVLACSIFCGLSGVGLYFTGYFTPWLMASSLIMSVGCGLVSTFHMSIPASKWIGFQIIAGAGFGLGIQMPVIIVQVVLPPEDIATGTAVIMFAQTLGGALFVAVAQNVFLNDLAKRIEHILPGFSVKMLYESTGATSVRDVLGETNPLLPKVLDAYSTALVQTFYAAAALSALSLLGAVFVQWKSVKGKFLIGAG